MRNRNRAFATATLATVATLRPVDKNDPLGLSADDLEGLHDAAEQASYELTEPQSDQESSVLRED